MSAPKHRLRNLLAEDLMILSRRRRVISPDNRRPVDTLMRVREDFECELE
jgi:hypothetical protein